MGATKLKLRLRQAMKLWQEARESGDYVGAPGFLDGVRRGFQETFKVIKELQAEEVQALKPQREPMTRWNAIVLYRACQGAYRRLALSDRAGAMAILRRALSRVTLRSGSKSAHRA